MNISYFEELETSLKISKETNKDIKCSSISILKNGIPVFSLKDIYIHKKSNKSKHRNYELTKHHKDWSNVAAV